MLYVGVRYILPHFAHFLLLRIKFGTACAQKNKRRRSLSKSAQWSHIEGRNWICVPAFHICRPILVKFGTRDLHVTLLNIWGGGGVRENRYRGSRAFVVGVNEKHFCV
jgi:hypothetical protein